MTREFVGQHIVKLKSTQFYFYFFIVVCIDIGETKPMSIFLPKNSLTLFNKQETTVLLSHYFFLITFCIYPIRFILMLGYNLVLMIGSKGDGTLFFRYIWEFLFITIFSWCLIVMWRTNSACLSKYNPQWLHMKTQLFFIHALPSARHASLWAPTLSSTLYS